MSERAWRYVHPELGKGETVWRCNAPTLEDALTKFEAYWIAAASRGELDDVQLGFKAGDAIEDGATSDRLLKQVPAELASSIAAARGPSVPGMGPVVKEALEKLRKGERVDLGPLLACPGPVLELLHRATGGQLQVVLQPYWDPGKVASTWEVHDELVIELREVVPDGE